MSEFEDEEYIDEPAEADESCDYGCGEICSEPDTRENGLCTTECQAYLCQVEADADGGTSGWKCTDCGCTDGTPCVGNLGQTCHWIRKNLCSACAEKRKQQEGQQ